MVFIHDNFDPTKNLFSNPYAIQLYMVNQFDISDITVHDFDLI